MAYRFFTIPIHDHGGAAEELNRLLAQCVKASVFASAGVRWWAEPTLRLTL